MAILTYFRKVCDTVVASISTAFGYQSVFFTNGRIIMIGKVLGEGAFSFVYAARSPTSNRVKYVVKKVFVQSADFERSVKAEVEAFQRFQHPNILQMIDHIFEDGRRGKIAYMLFPLAKRGSLRMLLNQRIQSNLPRPEMKYIFQDFKSICAAVNTLHTFDPSYVHQDIKPEVIHLLIISFFIVK